MHLVILGATGRSGVHAYQYALAQGHHVTVLVRKASGIEPHENLTVVEGTVQSASDMDRAFAASGIAVDAALIYLNAPRKSENPWAKFLGPPRLIADATANAARALRQQKRSSDTYKPRLVVMSAIGVGESRAVAPFITRFIIDYSNVGKTYEDHAAVDAEIDGNCGTAIDWTVVMPVALIGAGNKPVKTFTPTETGASFSISRESCAKWMVEVATREHGTEFNNRRVIISN
ncbi:hypothetical protein BDV96DRAFT_640460 [Lophiotrema nucula]|uniref:NAD(P)-binding domain-containing protein n=1 Tax=Lophiotrema nucula TaxID=690887 RepID=A0A6A5ZRW9_9PLEO|nr:hypothetical protein BDV96DRAFT_640460 [Lophiotrema nucula]